ncbi:MAG: hypothetical protein ACR2M1_09210 [Gemmatimonadaceae bacterium]
MGHNAAEVLVPLAGIFMILALSLGVPLVRSYTRRMEAKPHAAALPSGEVITRLDRIEQAIEAMATEVERIAERQRFTTKLLSPENGTPLHAPVAAGTPAAASVPAAQERQQAQLGTTLVEAARRT